jgi:NitT/TauT family transport system substrate-binding protein
MKTMVETVVPCVQNGWFGVRVVAAAAAVGLLIAGCRNSSSPAPGSSPSGGGHASVTASAGTGVPAASAGGTAAGVAPHAQPTTAQAPLAIAYSDWPGWVAWDIGVQKGWFQAAGVAVDFKWFEYLPSMEAFTAGKVDAVAITNGDQLVTGASGTPSVAIVVNDYSNGNDMIVAKPGISTVAQLKGKRIGVEVGFVSHLLLLNGLKSAGLAATDVTLVNLPTDQTPQALKSGKVDAIVAWQPNSGQALAEVPGSRPIFTSADVPGVIYDVLAVSPKSLAERRADWEKVVSIWFQIADYVNNEANRADVLSIMSRRASLTPEQYAPLLKGTFFLGAQGNLEHTAAGDSLKSVLFSSAKVNEFNLANEVYKVSQNPAQYLDSSLVKKVAKNTPDTATLAATPAALPNGAAGAGNKAPSVAPTPAPH